ncbi:hypothetical protein LTR56_018101 [Elasticomyces elasticus]|nr:hypothetical protein LTR56_018101 [Elasticomyces elasticus]KAK3642514.1 hypothetical protein LTR22_016049 [Elasticomyces elasticus]KAK4908859.1 hypothetical protein LTR49_022297 [Elasticomyces elasticus]KAK5748890.1 hypothetical protein LTS12_021060 [Elasticomyces elasticus]
MGSANDQDTTQQPAMSELFGIAELLEMVFLGLSMRDVLCNVQRTCRTWKAVVDSSLPIQQALFLKPITSMRLRCDDDAAQDAWSDGDQSIPQPIIFEHPFMTLLFDYADKAFSIRTNHPTGSWTKCLIAQPAIVQSKFKMNSIETKHEDLKDSEGLVIGALKLNERTWNAHDIFYIPGYTCWMSVTLTDELREIRQRILDQR